MNSRTLIGLVRHLGLGLLLIAGAAAVLLYSDLGSRRRADAGVDDPARQVRIALVQHASISAIDLGADGVLAALEARGYGDGARAVIRRYNAEGDMSTANAIAKEVTSAGYDLIITVSTASLQTVANANRFATPPRTHVFGITSDPYGAGVGVSRDNHLDHPPYMTGLGSLPPIEDAFALLKRMRPDVKRVGLVWNPTEANSVAATTIGRTACEKLGIELVEATAENATSAGESAASVLSRGIDALWVSPDVTVVTAVDVILAHAKRARVPVFTSLPGHAEKGALFDLGADYFGIGKAEGSLAADILDGTDPATIPVENLMPIELQINQLAIEGIPGRWTIPADALDRASLVIDAAGRHEKPAAGAANAAPEGGPAPRRLARRMTVDLIEYAETPNAELAREGLMAGFAEVDLVPGRDFELRRQSAQGDMATLSSLVDAALTRRTDLLLTMSTPSLQNALQRARGTPIVFGLVSNPFIVDAGKTDHDHLPYVTGSYLDQPVNEMLAVLRQVLPGARRIGTLFTPAEINSVFNKDQLESAAKKAGFAFEAVAINSSTEVTEAAATIAGRGLDALTQVTDNLIGSSFPAVMEATRRARIPVITYAPTVADMGPLVIVARDYYDNGVETAKMTARVLRGERTADIPFSAVPTINYIVNLKVAADYHVRIPADLVTRAARVIR